MHTTLTSEMQATYLVVCTLANSKARVIVGAFSLSRVATAFKDEVMTSGTWGSAEVVEGLLVTGNSMVNLKTLRNYRSNESVSNLLNQAQAQNLVQPHATLRTASEALTARERQHYEELKKAAEESETRTAIRSGLGT